jgi:hypothetical protein
MMYFVDFGVSYWVDENDQVKKKPFYHGGDKEVYKVPDAFSLTFQFDIRYSSHTLSVWLTD